MGCGGVPISPPLLRDIRDGRSSPQTEFPSHGFSVLTRECCSSGIKSLSTKPLPVNRYHNVVLISSSLGIIVPFLFQTLVPGKGFQRNPRPACLDGCYLPGTAPEQGGELGLKNKGKKKLNKQQTGMGMLVWDPLSLSQRLESKIN